MIWYYKVLVHKPSMVIVSVAVFAIACIIVSLRKIPDFSDPTLGFETRGTDISQRITAWRNLLEETRPSRSLVTNPKDLFPPTEADIKLRKIKHQQSKKNRKKKKKVKFTKKMRVIKDFAVNNKEIDFGSLDNAVEESNDTAVGHTHYDYGKNVSYDPESNERKNKLKKTKWENLAQLYPPPLTTDIHISSDGFFCESPNKDYVHFVVKRVRRNLNESLFELNALLAMCDLEQRILEMDSYDDLCQREVSSNNCCRPWSLPNYVAVLSNKTSCFDLEEDDVQNVRTLLFDCTTYYNTLKLNNDCTNLKCRVPDECAQFNAVYNVLHYLSDRSFIKLNESIEYLTAAMLFVPIARSSKAMPLYHELLKENLQNELVGVASMDMGLKNALFDECLLSDGWLVGLGGIFVLLSMWFYTSSLFVTLMTVVAIVFSLGISYFIYTTVYELKFFPFMNLLTVIVVVGIGSDDAFIFFKIWKCVLIERVKTVCSPLTPSSSFASESNQYDSLVCIMKNTLKHASISMFVTSLTTSAAFFTSFFSSDIIAVRLFGIFAGTACLANYLLMITWLPASVSIAERMNCISVAALHNFKLFTSKFQKLTQLSHQISCKIEEVIIGLVENFAIVWIVVLGLFGVMCTVIVLYYPKLQLPDTADFKLFVDSHPFEVYDSHHKDLFWFEKIYTSTDSFKLPLRFVWGVVPTDSGNFLDPTSRGDLVFEPTFNISAKESQVWLLNFCRNLKHQPFYQPFYGMLLVPNCFIENFISWMGRKCIDSMSDLNRTPCCESSSFPFETEIFDLCLPESISSLYETPREFFLPGVAGPKFSRNSTTISANNQTIVTQVKALVVEFDSTQSFSMSYTEMYSFVELVQGWLDHQLQKAPDGMKNAFFVSDLEFFDLQSTLSKGTLISIFVAMTVSLLVLLLVTLNLLVSFYAILTVTLTIFSIVGCLVLLGWKLNVLESVAVSTAIGLAVDFSLHYGVQYRYATDLDRKASTRTALQRMIQPTALAALTTGAAGAFMIPSSVLAYIQIGIFLVVSMTISWIFSTFFLMSLLYLIGPENGFGQFKIPNWRKPTRESNQQLKDQIDIINNTIIPQNQSTASEQLLSTSSSAVGDFNGSESLELDSLTSGSLVKTISIECNSHPIVGQNNYDRLVRKTYSYNREHSPSSVSAVTIIPDDIVPVLSAQRPN